MSHITGAFIVFGILALGMLILFIRERQAVARRRAERGGRDVDVWKLFTDGGDPANKTHQ